MTSNNFFLEILNGKKLKLTRSVPVPISFYVATLCTLHLCHFFNFKSRFTEKNNKIVLSPEEKSKCRRLLKLPGFRQGRGTFLRKSHFILIKMRKCRSKSGAPSPPKHFSISEDKHGIIVMQQRDKQNAFFIFNSHQLIALSRFFLVVFHSHHIKRYHNFSPSNTPLFLAPHDAFN